MPRFLLAALFALLALALPVKAQNQPQSTRPFKGPPFAVFTGVTSTGTEACNATVLDMRAYNSLIVRISESSGGGTSEAAVFGVAGRYVRFCRQSISAYGNEYHVIRTYASEDGATAFFLAPYMNVAYVTETIQAHTPITVVATPVPDPLLVATVGARTGLVTTATGPVIVGGLSDQNGGIGVPATANMAYPGAWTVRSAWAGDVDRCGGTSPNAAVASTNNGSKIANPALAALSATGQDGTDVTIQNVGTVALYCKVGDNSTPPTITSSNYKFALAAGTASNDGTGGSATITGVNTREAVYCLAASGTGAAAFFCR